MRKFVLLALVASVLMVSCQKSTEYITKATSIDLSIVESSTSAAYVKANVRLKDDRAYYICGIVADSLYKAKDNNDRFMQLVIDYEYKEYINWRYTLLEKDSEYVASFADHCLYYGNDDRFFTGLTPRTSYMVYAFCVNPDTMTPMGEMVYQYVTTLPVIESDMTFKARFEQKEDGPYITVIPSNDDEPYIWDYVETEFAISQYGSIAAYTEALLNYYKENGLSELLRITGFSNWNAVNDLKKNKNYTLFAVGYDGFATTDLFTWKFSYPFTEEPKDRDPDKL